MFFEVTTKMALPAVMAAISQKKIASTVMKQLPASLAILLQAPARDPARGFPSERFTIATRVRLARKGAKKCTGAHAKARRSQRKEMGFLLLRPSRLCVS